jgi:hypothetical protein
MKIIRRRRTVTIETCAFRRWQTEGTEESFSCPNCGKVFEQEPLPGATKSLPAALIANILAEGAEIDRPVSDTNDTPPPCGETCND